MIKRFLEHQKKKKEDLRRQEIITSFNISESEKSVCITHNGDVIRDFSPTDTIEHIIEELCSIRNTALKYHGL